MHVFQIHEILDVYLFCLFCLFCLLVVFFVCFVLSVPAMVINGNGNAYKDKEASSVFKQMMALSTMGNVGSYQDLDCNQAFLPDTDN